MPGSRLLPHLLAVAIVGSLCVPVYAVDGYTPRPQRTFSEKPRIEDYADYNAFLVDIMEYRRQKQRILDEKQRQAAEAAAAAEAAGFPVEDNTLASINAQGAQDLEGLYQITQPETLDEALERAKKLPHPVYTEPERFGRTTSYSFPIPQIDGAELYTSEEMEGKLQDLESLTPETFRDNGDEANASKVLAKNPSNEDEQADIKATDIADAMYRPFYDMATRIIQGSDGKVVWLPMFVDGEAGRTTIYKLDIDVHTFTN